MARKLQLALVPVRQAGDPRRERQQSLGDR